MFQLISLFVIVLGKLRLDLILSRLLLVGRIPLAQVLRINTQLEGICEMKQLNFVNTKSAKSQHHEKKIVLLCFSGRVGHNNTDVEAAWNEEKHKL